MARKRGRPRVAGLGYHKNLGQYRKVVQGRSIYFGSDPDEALARYQLYKETGLLWKRGYRQFCLEKDGEIMPLGATGEVARRNYAALQDREKRSLETPKPDVWKRWVLPNYYWDTGRK